MDAIKVFLDTNVVLDYYTGRMRNNLAEKVVQIGQYPEFELCISVLSAVNVLYVLKKCTPSLKASDIPKLFQILPMDYKQYLDAQSLDIADFEDALQIECARKNNCKVIVSRDSHMIDKAHKSPIILSPEEFIRRCTE